MSWQDRPYSGGEDSNAGYGGQGGGGARSWLGGLPRAGKAVKWIALANVAIFLLCQITGGSESVIFEYLSMQTDKVTGGQIWRLFTFTYIHDQSGLWHVGFNMLGLYFLGSPLERHWGTKRFFWFYTLGGFVAVLLYFGLTITNVLNPIGTLVGASGGVLAVLGACAVLFPHMRLILILFPVPIRAAALIFAVFYAFNLWNRGPNAGGDACHFAGLAFGIAWGYRGQYWLRKIGQARDNVKRGAWEAKRRQHQALENDVDHILAKLHREGISSLSRSDKRKLQAATKNHQDDDRSGRL